MSARLSVPACSSRPKPRTVLLRPRQTCPCGFPPAHPCPAQQQIKFAPVDRSSSVIISKTAFTSASASLRLISSGFHADLSTPRRFGDRLVANQHLLSPGSFTWYRATHGSDRELGRVQSDARDKPISHPASQRPAHTSTKTKQYLGQTH